MISPDDRFSAREILDLKDRLTRVIPLRIHWEAAPSMVPEGVVYVGPGSRWANPFRVGERVHVRSARRWDWRLKHPEYVCATAGEAVTRFAAALYLDECMMAEVKKGLAGKHLACVCPPGALCHAGILLKVANV